MVFISWSLIITKKTSYFASNYSIFLFEKTREINIEGKKMNINKLRKKILLWYLLSLLIFLSIIQVGIIQTKNKENLKDSDSEEYPVSFNNLPENDMDQPTFEKIGEWDDNYGWPNDLFIQNEKAYIANSCGDLIILGLRNPIEPEIIGEYSCSSTEKVFVNDSYIYIISYENGLEILDSSNLTNLQKIGHYDDRGFQETYENLFFADGYIFLADNLNHLKIIDLSNPSSPQKIAEVQTSDIRAIAVQNNLVYLVGYENALEIYDVSNITAPLKISTVNESTSAAHHDIFVVGDNAFIVDYNIGLKIYNISDPLNPFKISQYNDTNDCCRIFVKNDFAYLGYQYNVGLKIINITNPLKPECAYDLGFENKGRIYDIFVMNNYAFIAGIPPGIAIVDVTNPLSPTVIGEFSNGGIANKVEIEQGFAFLADGYNGLEIIDVHNPANPIEVGHDHQSGDNSLDVVVDENIAYLANDKKGLAIIDVADPYSPTRISNYYSGNGRIMDIFIRDQLAFLANKEVGLEIIDVGDPFQPVKISQFTNIPGLQAKEFDVTITPNPEARMTDQINAQLIVGYVDYVEDPQGNFVGDMHLKPIGGLSFTATIMYRSELQIEPKIRDDGIQIDGHISFLDDMGTEFYPSDDADRTILLEIMYDDPQEPMTEYVNIFFDDYGDFEHLYVPKTPGNYTIQAYYAGAEFIASSSSPSVIVDTIDETVWTSSTPLLPSFELYLTLGSIIVIAFITKLWKRKQK